MGRPRTKPLPSPETPDPDLDNGIEQVVDLVAHDPDRERVKMNRSRSGRHKGVVPIMTADGLPERQMKLLKARMEGQTCLEACETAGIQASSAASASKIVNQSMKKFLPQFIEELETQGLTMPELVKHAIKLLNAKKMVNLGHGVLAEDDDNFVQQKQLEWFGRVLRLEPEKSSDVNVNLTVESFVTGLYQQELESGAFDDGTIDV